MKTYPLRVDDLVDEFPECPIQVPLNNLIPHTLGFPERMKLFEALEALIPIGGIPPRDAYALITGLKAFDVDRLPLEDIVLKLARMYPHDGAVCI